MGLGQDTCPNAAMTMTLAFVEERGVGMGGEYHAADPICDAVVWVGGNIIEGLVDGHGGVFSCCECLLGTSVTEGDKELAAHGTSVIEEGVNNSLETYLTPRLLSGELAPALVAYWTLEPYMTSVGLYGES